MDLSIQKKTIILIISIIILMAVSSAFYFGRIVKEFQNEQCNTRARELANTAAIYMDFELLEDFKAKVSEIYGSIEHRVSNAEMGTEEYESYIGQFAHLEETEEFQELYRELRNIMDGTDVDCLYICYVDEKTKSVVYLIDAGDNNVCHAGSFDELIGSDLKVLSDPELSISASITNPETYGDIVGTALPIHNAQNKVTAYLGVDIAMGQLESQRDRVILNSSLTLIIVAMLFGAVSLFLTGQILQKPIDQHQKLVEEAEVLRRENRSLERKARAAQRISDLQGSISALLENMPAMTHLKDVENGHYLACNQMFAEYVGKKSPALVIGHSDSELFDEATASHFTEDDMMALTMDEPYIFHEEVTDAEGNKRSFQTTKLKFTNENGRVCLLGMSVDVSELVSVRQENAKNMKAYEHAKRESLTYSRIARALSTDYTFIYYVDLETGKYREYSSVSGHMEMEIEKEGTDFFPRSLRDAKTAIYHDDFDRFTTAFTKENVLRTIDETGSFTITYRLLMEGKPVYVNLKAARMEWDRKHIIIGVTNVDAEMKEREEAERMLAEQATYKRIVALSGQFICIYNIDPETGRYVEYAATNDYASLDLAKEGDDFFDKSRTESMRVVYPPDLEIALTALNMDYIIKQIRETGLFSVVYRLMLDGIPNYIG